MSNEKTPYIIQYTVGLDYITPATRQRVGMSGNHNATRLDFTVDEALKTTLKNGTGDAHDGGGVKYRFDVYNAAGEVFRTESQYVSEDYVLSYNLQERDTRYGGVIKVVLVLTAFDGDVATVEVFCRPALLQTEGITQGTNRFSYTELEQKSLDAADAALEVKEAYDSGKLKGEKGDKGDKGDPGDDYILTEEDKQEISTKIHEKYFDITTNGIISLKPEYRGKLNNVTSASDSVLSSTSLPFAVSDNGADKVGSKYYELPHEINIPLTVNGITVTGYQMGIFACNLRIERIVLNPNVTELNSAFAYRAFNFRELYNTDNITSVKPSCFIQTRIKDIKFPNLTTLGSQAFRTCGELEYANIGKVKDIPKQAFACCYKLKGVEIDSPAKTIGDGTFFECYNLRTIENIVAPNITTGVGKSAFVGCSATYNWSSLTGCTFGSYATSSQLHATEFWEGVEFTPCENQAKSFLSQQDIRWQDVVTDPERPATFNIGCEAISVMGVWCSLNNVTVDDARDYLEICKKYGTEFKYADDGLNTENAHAFYSAMGLSYSAIAWGGFGAGSVENIYKALAEGKYVIIEVPSGPDAVKGHVVTLTGVTPLGELLIQDPANLSYPTGTRENSNGKVPIQNLINTVANKYGIAGVILGKAVT
jgi:hypothetical protein